MPDSQLPPHWGPAYDERDLDALLSGQSASTPAALRPVESTLAALRADATGRELAREAAARAAFRAFAPGRPSVAPTAWTTGPEAAAVSAHTLILPPADGRPQPAPRRRHRHRRKAARAARRPGLAVTGVAATALVVVAVAVTGALTGSIGKLTSFGRPPASASASARATAHSPATQGPLATGAAQVPTPSPHTATASAHATPRPTSGPGSLCREYFEYFEYPEHPIPGGAAAWFSVGRELSKLAGGPFKVYGYCLRYLDNPLAGRGGWPMIGPGADGPGESGRGDQGSGSVSPANVSSPNVSPANISGAAVTPASRDSQGAGTGDQASRTTDQVGGTADSGRVSDPGAPATRP
jgi:hypothetical protein